MTAVRAPWTWLGGLDPRYPVSFLITLILVLGEARYGILGGYDRLAMALGVSTATELVLSRLVRGRIANVASAYITGISLALLIKPRAGLLWPFALGGFVAIASKYVLQYRGRHLWNPSNFAISLLVLAAPGSIAILSRQWGNDLATNTVIWCFGWDSLREGQSIMTDNPVELDEHRGMAAQKSTEIRRRFQEVQADQAALRRRQEEFESHALAAPSTTWARLQQRRDV